MLTTNNNPAGNQPYLFRPWRAILSSIFEKIKNGEWLMAFRFFVTETMNRVEKGKILNMNGTNFCPVCECHNESFVHLSNRMRYSFNSACPHCSSRPRHRGLYYFYKDFVSKFDSDKTVLHFAPEPAFYPIFKNKSFQYKTTDYFLADVDLPHQDIQNLQLPDKMVDLVLCNHVIEHVSDDMKALSEIYRILKVGGVSLITVPGDFFRQETVYFKDLKYNGHYRDYGMDFSEKLRNIFDDVQIKELHEFDAQGILKIPRGEWLFIASRYK